MLDIKDNPEVTADVPIYDTFVVQVPAVTQDRTNALLKACREVNQGSAFLSEEEQNQRFQAEYDRLAPDLYCKGWRGLTLRVAAHLGLAFNTPPDLATEKSGEREIQCIAFEPQNLRVVWKKAYPHRFRNLLVARSQDVLEAEAVAERERGNS